MAVNLAVILAIFCFIGNLVSHQSHLSELYLHHVSTRIYLVRWWRCQTNLKIHEKFAFKLGGGSWLLDLEIWLFIRLKIFALKLSLCQIKKKKICVVAWKSKWLHPSVPGPCNFGSECQLWLMWQEMRTQGPARAQQTGCAYSPGSTLHVKIKAGIEI